MRIVRLFAVAILLAGTAGAQDAISLATDKWTVRIVPSTLAAEATRTDGYHVRLSRATVGAALVADLQTSGTEARWRLPVESLAMSAALTSEGFRLTFRSTPSGSVTWPVVGEEQGLEAVVLPRAEGLYVPLAESRWRRFLQENSPFDLMESLSMPAWGLRYPGLTVAYIAENPFDNELTWNLRGTELVSRMTHRFQRNQPDREHSMMVRFGGVSPVETAVLFRQWYSKRYPVMTYPEKIRALPDAQRLLGAPHVYLWAHTPLAVDDVRDWRGLVQTIAADERLLSSFSVEAQQAVRDATSAKVVTMWQKRPILEAISSQTEKFEKWLVSPDRRGAAVSPKMIRKLRAAGLDRLWLGVDEIGVARALPETATAARDAGYLFAPYDSYHSMHSPNEKDTWNTAQFGQELYSTGGVVNSDGTMSAGFNGKGVHLSSNAAFPYVQRRVEGILKDIRFNSWFIDCDATGELFDNYSSEFSQTKEQDMQARIDRMRWLRDDQRLVVGSEGGSWYAAPVIHFAHGMMTPLFGWRDPLLHDPKSEYFVGRYYPPDAPPLFMKPVDVPEKYRALYFDPRYRLPLFQAAFHDSMITTNHWTQGSLKFPNVAIVRELLELLYGVPPLYHLNFEQFDALVPAMKEHYDVFSPLHREIGGLPLTSFEWLTGDRLLQRSIYGGKVEVIANFGLSAADYAGARVPALSIVIKGLEGRVPLVYTPHLRTSAK